MEMRYAVQRVSYEHITCSLEDKALRTYKVKHKLDKFVLDKDVNYRKFKNVSAEKYHKFQKLACFCKDKKCNAVFKNWKDLAKHSLKHLHLPVVFEEKQLRLLAISYGYFVQKDEIDDDEYVDIETVDEVEEQKSNLLNYFDPLDIAPKITSTVSLCEVNGIKDGLMSQKIDNSKAFNDVNDMENGLLLHNTKPLNDVENELLLQKIDNTKPLNDVENELLLQKIDNAKPLNDVENELLLQKIDNAKPLNGVKEKVDPVMVIKGKFDKYFKQHTRHSCPGCPRIFYTLKGCQKHVVVEHTNICQCLQCGEDMYTQVEMKKHIQDVHKDNFTGYYCDLCYGVVGNNIKLFKRHLQKDHNIPLTIIP